MSDLELPRRPLGPAFVTGLARGAFASLLPLAAATVTTLLAWRDPALAVTVALLTAWTGAALGVAEALSSRAPSSWDQAARFLSGLGVALAAAIPLLGTFSDWSAHLPWITFPLGDLPMGRLVWAGLSLGTALALAGPHTHGASLVQRLRRSQTIAIVFSFCAGTGGILPVAFAKALVAACGLAALYALGHLIARDLGRSLGVALEDGGGLAEAERSEQLRRAQDCWKRALDSAAAAPNEASRRFHQASALEFARAALEPAQGISEDLGQEWARRVVALLFELDRLDEIDMPLEVLPEGDVLRAERLRRQGDLEGALAHARRCLDAVATSADRQASAVRVNAHAIIALVRHAQGDQEAAEKHHRWAKTELAWADPVLPSLHADALEPVIKPRPRALTA